MKKIILLISLIFLLSGCMDYKEIDSLAYITAIGYDYVDDEFVVTYEVIENKKEGDTIKLESYTATGKGKSNYISHLNAGKKVSKTPSFSHAFLMVLSTNVVGDKLKEVTDFILRNAQLNGEFNLVLTDDHTPEEILNNKTKEEPVASFYIYDYIVNNIYDYSFAVDFPFIKIGSLASSDKKDITASVMVIDDEKFSIKGSALFDGYNIKYITNREEANIYKTLTDKRNKLYLLNEIKGKNLETLTNFIKVNYDVTANNIKINIEGESELKTVPDTIDIHEEKTYPELINKLEKTIKEKVTDYIYLLQRTKSDVLGFAKNYHIKTRKHNKDLWTVANVDVNVTISITKKGMIYNVDQ